ncbi:MAG: STAS domain-containing protein [Planctomycetes bacterium]|nr:STAS domain-containing protein [Planctomycetota bacterium]
MIDFERQGDVVVARPNVETIFEKETTEKIYKSITDELERKGGKKLVVDFEKVESFSSNFIGMLVGLKKKLKEKGGDLRICNLNDRLSEIAEVTQLNQILAIFGRLDKAIASFAK